LPRCEQTTALGTNSAQHAPTPAPIIVPCASTSRSGRSASFISYTCAPLHPADKHEQTHTHYSPHLSPPRHPSTLPSSHKLSPQRSLVPTRPSRSTVNPLTKFAHNGHAHITFFQLEHRSSPTPLHATTCPSSHPIQKTRATANRWKMGIGGGGALDKGV
jgi:hypothetical protein